MAQNAPANTTAQTAQPTSLSEVVVTGTRILRRDFSSPSPIMTVPVDQLQQTSEVSIDQALQMLPQFNPGNNQINQAFNVQATATSTPGAATANLRGLGAQRNLVLLDGHRAQPTDASLVIDLNTIPVSAIDSIEVVTGGAAATYGADALAGVVNFKLKKHFQGIELDGQYGESQRGDDRNTNLSALIGTNVADNHGNVMFGATFSDRTAVNVRDRAWANAANTDPNTPGGAFPGFAGFNLIPYIPGSFCAACNPFFPFNVPSQAAVDQVFGAYPPGTVGNATALYFNTAPTTAGSTIFSVSPGAGGQSAPGYTGPLYPNFKYLSDGSLATNNNPSGPLSQPLRRYSFFGDATYAINDYVDTELRGYFVRNESDASFGTPTPAVNQWGVTIPYTEAYDDPSSPTFMNAPAPPPGSPPFAYHPVPPELATLLNSRPDPTAPWQLNTFPYYVGNRRTTQSSDTYQLSWDWNGKLGLKDWTWELYGSIGQTDSLLQYFGFLDLLSYQTLISQSNYGAGYTANVGLIGRLATCTSGLNPFVNTPVSQDCIDIVDAQLNTTTQLGQRIAELNFQGAGFNLPGGESRFALGADFRFDGIDYRPDKGMQAANIVSNAVGIFGAQPVHGSETVKEGYIEADLPVLGGLPAVKKLDFNLGYRYSDYNSEAGAVDTWKALLNWQINDYVTIRGGPQRANRAPNVGELYTPSTVLVTLWPSGDPCSINNVVPWGNTAGNPNQNKVIALCNQLTGNPANPITSTYPGLGFYFPLALDQQIGNPALKSEAGTTWTIGAVLKAPFESPAVSNLTATIDYYHIRINGAITPLTSQIVYSQCLNSNGISNPNYDINNTYCQLIRRAATGATDTVLGIFTNIGYLETGGIDLALDWHARLADMGMASAPGSLFVTLNASWLQKFVVQVANGDTPVDYKGSTGFDTNTGVQFTWRSLLTLGYSVGPVDLGMRWRHLPSVENAARVLSPTAKVADTASNDQFDLYGTWNITDALALRAGVVNLLDKDPPLVGVTPTNDQAGVTDATGVYDELGREFYIGVRAKF